MGEGVVRLGAAQRRTIEIGEDRIEVVLNAALFLRIAELQERRPRGDEESNAENMKYACDLIRCVLGDGAMEKLSPAGVGEATRAIGEIVREMQEESTGKNAGAPRDGQAAGS